MMRPSLEVTIMHDRSIRLARSDEAKAITTLVRGSISELCFDDHHGDDTRINAWLANKTEDEIAVWIAVPDLLIFVIECRTGLVAAGCHRDDGVILMNYVSPFYRFQGLSDRMLSHLESSLAALGIATARLVSTRTAIGFYKKRGWHAYGDPIPCMGVTGQPMMKDMARQAKQADAAN
jgi:ribosomal protein S18 acetylase RimI-like enzyme